MVEQTTILWPSSSRNLCLDQAEVHAWVASLNLDSDLIASVYGSLGEDEKERSRRFRFELHANRFIARRAFLRVVLASYLGSDPAELKFSASANGKPVLEAPCMHAQLHFNLSHSADLALLGVTNVGPIGVDVERLRPIENAAELVERFFSPREHMLFGQLPEIDRSLAFYNLWTRKEAWLKATGEGITRLLNRVEVTLAPAEPPKFIALPEPYADQCWSLCEVTLCDGYVAAIAVLGGPKPVLCRHWDWSITDSGCTERLPTRITEG